MSDFSLNHSEALERIRSANRLVVLTGAGISAESGIPTFREAQQGLWSRFRPEELAAPKAFQEHPRRVLTWYQWRIKAVQAAHPNPGHLALAELEEKVSQRGASFTLLTQNVDLLHQKAGSKSVVKLHGSLEPLVCSSCGKPSKFNLAGWNPQSKLPTCQTCRGLLRPNVIWFGESLDPDLLEQAQQASIRSDLFLVIGTSAVVQPAASLPYLAAERGAEIFEINPRTTPITSLAAYHFPAPAGKILPKLMQEAYPGAENAQ